MIQGRSREDGRDRGTVLYSSIRPGPDAERSWLRRHEIHPRRRLGQSFLVQPQVADRLVRAMALAKDSRILEIGPGAGAMTRALLDEGMRIWAVEVDPKLALLLQERFHDAIQEERLHLISGDILTINPGSIPDLDNGPVHLVGNLPYAITTPILLWGLEHRRRFKEATFLIQREVAERLAAAPGSRTYGSITVWVAYHGAVSKLTTVEPGAFWPVPKVDSSLVAIRFHERPPVAADPEMVQKVLAAAFGQRRKMIRSSLLCVLGERTAELLREMGIDPTRRAETLTLEEFAAIARLVPRPPAA